MIVGVDFDTYKATLCAIPFDRLAPRWATAEFRPARATGEDEAIRALARVRKAVYAGITEIVVGPTVIFVERGFGMSRRADWILGAFFGAIYVSLADPTSRLVVNPMEAREWKRDLTGYVGHGLTTKGAGNANAKKDVANEAARILLAQPLVELPPSVEAASLSPDELDAFSIAWAGRRLNATASVARAPES